MKSTALALLLGATCFAQKRPITHEDVWMMKRTGEPVVSPDGRSIVVPVAEPDYDPAKQLSDLWLVAADGHEPPRRLTFNKAAESDPRVHDAVLTALDKARTTNTDYSHKDGVAVTVQLDLQDVWDALRATE